jgi:hypothetical protein
VIDQEIPMANGKQYNVILIGDDGKPYLLAKEKWQVKENLLPEESPAQAPIKQAITFGTLLADISDLGLGIGGVCIFVNVKKMVTGK